jgi:formylmethanofuran dehydrogenase subunit E
MTDRKMAIHKAVECEACSAIGVALSYHESLDKWLCKKCAGEIAKRIVTA